MPLIHTYYQDMREKNPHLPERIGESWNEEEETKVLNFIQEEYSIEEIANELKRTNGSIRARLRNIAIDMFKKNISIEKICLATSLNEEDIKKAIKRDELKQVEKIRKKEKLAQVPVADLMEIKFMLLEIKELLRNSKHSE
jgi:hypothetical protein